MSPCDATRLPSSPLRPRPCRPACPSSPAPPRDGPHGPAASLQGSLGPRIPPGGRPSGPASRGRGSLPPLLGPRRPGAPSGAAAARGSPRHPYRSRCWAKATSHGGGGADVSVRDGGGGDVSAHGGRGGLRLFEEEKGGDWGWFGFGFFFFSFSVWFLGPLALPSAAWAQWGERRGLVSRQSGPGRGRGRPQRLRAGSRRAARGEPVGAARRGLRGCAGW